MNLKLIRLRARTMQVQQPGLAILFALPVLFTILANFLLSGQDLVDLLPDMTLQQASIYMIQRQLFPSVVSFVISILVVGATHPLCGESHQHLRQHSIFGDLR